MVGYYGWFDAQFFEEERQEEDVCQGMVFTFACSCYVGYGSIGFDVSRHIACGFGKVVIFLFVYDVQSVAQPFLHGGRKRVSVADNSHGVTVV